MREYAKTSLLRRVSLGELRREIRARRNPAKAAILQRFFKTGKGEYGEGDRFYGITVPESRALARRYAALSFEDLRRLLRSEVHEERLIALLILVHRFGGAGVDERERIVNFYLKSTRAINNWDLVDLSADKILGVYLLDKKRGTLYRLARSKNLWERRIAIVATYQFIRRGDFGDTLRIAKLLLSDTHDLIHKAVGWMLREVGKKNQGTLERFLDARCHRMPRTMLRYAIERLPAAKRAQYLRT